MQKQNHPYHIIDQRPWPIISATITILIIINFISIFQKHKIYLRFLTFTFLLLIIYTWWQDVTRERTFKGLHSFKTIKRLKTGIILFIISEVIFFFSFFWTFFHSSLNPVIELGYNWPPTAIQYLNYIEVPLLNSLVLLTSGVTVTISHHYILSKKNITKANLYIIITIILGLYFTILQAIEYIQTSYTLADSVYGSIFFVTTGFHGLHVIIGSSFLLVILIRILKAHLSNTHHVGLESSIWYWHFVDVVWLFLYTFVYWWGSY